MSRDSYDPVGELGNNKRERRYNTGRFERDFQESQVTRDLNFKQRISKHESGIMAAAKKDVVTIPPTTTIMGAARTMVDYGYRRLPVADPGTKRLEGICTVLDIIDFLGGGEKSRIIERNYDGNLIVAINSSIRDIMQQNVVVVTDDSSLEDAINTMVQRSVGGVPVVSEDGRVVGILTERDVVRIMSQSITGKKVEDIMSRNVRTAPPDMPIESAAQTMISSGFRRLPVVTNGIVVGFITATDIMRYLGSGEAFKKLVTGNVHEAFGAPIKSIMKGDLITVSPDDDLGSTAIMMARNGIGSLPVISDGRLAGILTEYDILMSLKG